MNDMKLLLRWALYILLFLVMYQAIGGLWLAAELRLDGISFESTVDSIVAGYLAMRAAVWVMKGEK